VESDVDSALVLHRLHFAFTITYHYLFPQLTMGLAPIIVVLQTMALLTGRQRFQRAARFWGRIFAVSFLFGVVTGIPMEFQFGTNWARFANFSGGVIATSLAMEGVFSFFLESAFLGIFLYGAHRVSARLHWLAAVLLCAGSWLSGYFIIVTDAWMQRPVGFEVAANGTAHLTSFWALLSNEWAFWQFLHNMSGAVVTGSFAVAGLGAYYVLARKHEEFARLFVSIGLLLAVVASGFQLWPSGDQHGRLIALHQPATLAAMEGMFHTEAGAAITIVGQPDVERLELDNPIRIPRVLSFLTYRRWLAEVRGLTSFQRELWPDNIPLLYYAYHIMVGLGTLFIAITLLAAYYWWRGRLYDTSWLLWVLVLSVPLPFVANTAGWMTAELGRQPWLVYGVMRTVEGSSSTVSAGNALFTLLGYMGLYTVLSILFVVLIMREISEGPAPTAEG
jgi:cytochrome d ubiquinol oxidase subunit I